MNEIKLNNQTTFNERKNLNFVHLFWYVQNTDWKFL